MVNKWVMDCKTFHRNRVVSTQKALGRCGFAA